jgi:hypothetical protein
LSSKSYQGNTVNCFWAHLIRKIRQRNEAELVARCLIRDLFGQCLKVLGDVYPEKQ